MVLPVSIVVVSRHRPAALMRCLTGISQLDYPSYEVIVVACPDGLAALARRPDADQIKQVAYDEPNISAARNLGISRAAGEVVAFIDDDAVPEPLWLTHLAAPFETADIAAAGGFVIGRNGITFQWTARTADATGQATPLDVSDMQPTVLHPTPDRAIKTEGTNMALRRDVLAQMGGFDPAFRYFLDETDVNLRLAQRGLATAIVPLAQVHHGFAESASRASDRTPRDLTEIGASQQAFLRKHCPSNARAAAWDGFVHDQRKRLLGYMQRGPLDPMGVRRLMRGLERGGRDGAERILERCPEIPRAAQGFLPYPGRPGAPRVRLSGRTWQAAQLRRTAAEKAAQGAIVSLYILSPGARFHRVRFTDTGVWEQTGGLFGRSVRKGPLWQPWSHQRRVDSEVLRTQKVRG
ncbi:glycosyltransferase family 2 protein [Sagittula stellata]|uniref:Glycosyl transferase, family 2 n=1 Tax=Sagittula stellata (strain ATCC 700073 / DSM 11524 / E-37) TaxID=388399 RepID=A3KAS9_SAGS3|nr:glycosyltransferase [Sagittula stellata]EBA05725.1 glycosyl transferase, family 2 [Sagittula stellata E-37]